MDYEASSKTVSKRCARKGRYRVFADLEQRCGRFPRAFDHRVGTEVTTWGPIMTEVRVGKEPRCCLSFARDSA
jgi:hypothetical protein